MKARQKVQAPPLFSLESLLRAECLLGEPEVITFSSLALALSARTLCHAGNPVCTHLQTAPFPQQSLRSHLLHPPHQQDRLTKLVNGEIDDVVIVSPHILFLGAMPHRFK